MKNILIFVVIFTIFGCTANAQSKYVYKNREMLKEYFLYSCIINGLNKFNIKEIDNSGAVYVDLLRYDLIALHKTDSLARNFVDSIKPSPYQNNNSRGIIILSIEEYKSEKLDVFIKLMDKYMLKEENE